MGGTADPCGTGYGSQEILGEVVAEPDAVHTVTRSSCQDAFHDHVT